MKKTATLIILLITFGLPLAAQDLEQTITLKAENKTLSEIFSLIEENYHMGFSYLNNELPTARMDVDFEGITLDQALENLLGRFNLVHIGHSGQVIIKKKLEGPVQLPQKKAVEAQIDTTLVAVADTTASIATPAEVVALPDTMHEEETIVDSVAMEATEALVANDTTEAIQDSLFAGPIPILYHSKGGVVEVQVQPQLLAASKQPEETPDTTILEVMPPEKRWGHVGLFYPFSSNGVLAGHYINHLSLHFLSGYSAGVEGIELSMLANITKGNVDGLQMTGVTNVVSGEATGLQVAGVANLVKGKMNGLQMAWVTNVAKGNHLGMQLAGATNVALGETSGFQGALGVNVARGRSLFGQMSMGVNVARDLYGPQLAGVLNVQQGKGSGLQAAGFLNLANDLNGAQASLFMNKASHIRGLQVAPFLNVAKKVDGVQIGFINIADSLKGVPIGFFSLVKRNGYYDLEMYYAEDFQANAAIKIGGKRFHNIFAFSYETDNKNRWAYGYGFGSQWGDHGLRLNTDLIGYYVVEQEFPKGAFKDYDLNVLAKFRMLASMHYNDFGVFAGPTFNVMVSNYVNAETGVAGSDIAPTPLYESTDRHNVNVKLWVGYNVGIRF